MICAMCKAENPVGVKACISCGRELGYTGAGYTPDVESVNNSGAAAEWQVPGSISGISMAGFVPFGLFAFFNGMMLWGVIGLVLHLVFFPLYIVYAGYITVYGRQEAWRNRRFANLVEFETTMSAWNNSGIICCVLAALFVLLWTWMFINVSTMEVPVATGGG